MTTDELLDAAVSSLRDTCLKIIEVAKDKEYLNRETPELKELNSELIKRFSLCFTIKNAIHDVTTQ